MTAALPHITVCICTFRRPRMLERLLSKIELQDTQGRFGLSIVVADNDPAGAARAIVEAFAAHSRLRVVYTRETRMNIALARNAALRQADGDYVAFIDDDEYPEPDWLASMLSACQQLGAAGILGPVRPHFEEAPPAWLVRGGFCERPEHPTGRVMHWKESRTGNLLFRRHIVADDALPFMEKFGTGGEDVDFFKRMSQRDHVFRWCNEGVTYETVPPDRWTRRYMLKRALLRGRNVLKHPDRRLKLLATSLVVVPAYVVLLPFTLPFGQHVFMKYCVRCFDHLGRLLAATGLNPVHTR